MGLQEVKRTVIHAGNVIQVVLVGVGVVYLLVAAKRLQV